MGTGIWTVTVSERMRSGATCQSAWWAKSRAQRTHYGRSHSLNTFFTLIQTFVLCSVFFWEHLTHGIWATWQTVALKVCHSWPYSPQIHMILLTDTAVQSLNYLCVSLVQKKCVSEAAVISSVFIFPEMRLFFHAESIVQCLLLLSINASITTSVSRHINDQV